MAVMPRSPFWDIEKFFKEWPAWPSFEVPEMPSASPRMNIFEENGNLIAEVEVPGVKAEDINVEIRDNVLRVKAEREEEKEEREKGYYRRELSRGYYRRAVSLPVQVRDEEAEAKCKNGVLTVTVPKVEKEKEEKKKGTKMKVKKE